MNTDDDEISRRGFLDRLGAAAVLGATGVKKKAQNAPASNAWTAPPVLKNPNILVILVDQLRAPMWMSASQLAALSQTLPNITGIQNNSYNFGQCFVAATMCTPSRSTLLTGLYAPQTAIYTNETGGSGPGTPLNPAYPTWGQAVPALNAAYQGNMWWFGKWHLSQTLSSTPLAAYGFQTRLYPGGPTAPYNYSPDGQPNEGADGGTFTGSGGGNGETWASDSMVASDFIGWLQGQAPTPSAPRSPWCATVSLLNPHDISCAPGWMTSTFPPPLAKPPVYFAPLAGGVNPPQFYTAAPSPWNNETLTPTGNKPALQYAYQQLRNTQLGAVTDWVKFLNQYIWLQSQVDAQIGRVLAALKSSPFASNTVIVFTSDHGEYAGSHGIHGKGFAAYEESLRVPFSVQFPGQTGSIQMNQMFSSVDFFGLMCDLATGGSGQWRLAYPDLAERQSVWSFLYGNRKETRVAPAPVGLPYILHTFDDSNLAKPHITCMRTSAAKLAFYTVWNSCSVYPNGAAPDWEYYDYASNTAEMGNDYFSSDPGVQARLAQHVQVLGSWPNTGIIGSQLNATLVGKGTDGKPLTVALGTAQQAYFVYIGGGGNCG